MLDDRDAGLTQLKDGTIVGHFWSTHWTKKAYQDLSPKAYGKDVIQKWIQFVEHCEKVGVYVADHHRRRVEESL